MVATLGEQDGRSLRARNTKDKVPYSGTGSKRLEPKALELNYYSSRGTPGVLWPRQPRPPLRGYLLEVYRGCLAVVEGEHLAQPLVPQLDDALLCQLGHEADEDELEQAVDEVLVAVGVVEDVEDAGLDLLEAVFVVVVRLLAITHEGCGVGRLATRPWRTGPPFIITIMLIVRRTAATTTTATEIQRPRPPRDELEPGPGAPALQRPQLLGRLLRQGGLG